MKEAKEISKKYATAKRDEMDGLRGYDILLDDTIERTIATAINEALEWAARQCEDEAQMQRTCLNSCGPIEACGYVAERIRAGKTQ